MAFEETGRPAVVVATTHLVHLAAAIKPSGHLEGLP
jgi:hypothetical protein